MKQQLQKAGTYGTLKKNLEVKKTYKITLFSIRLCAQKNKRKQKNI